MAKPFIPRFKKKTSPNRNIVKDIKSLVNIATAVPRTLIEEISIATSKKQKPTPSGVKKKKDTPTKDTSKNDTSTKDTSTKTKTLEGNVNNTQTSNRAEIVRQIQGKNDTPKATVTTEQDKIKGQIKKLEDRKAIASPRNRIAIQRKIDKLKEKLK
jgi:hypothetical protein